MVVMLMVTMMVMLMVVVVVMLMVLMTKVLRIMKDDMMVLTYDWKSHLWYLCRSPVEIHPTLVHPSITRDQQDKKLPRKKVLDVMIGISVSVKT